SGGKSEAWASIEDTNEDVPDRVYIQVFSTEGMSETMFSKYKKDRNLAKCKIITRYPDENHYLARALQKHKLHIDTRSPLKIFPTINVLDSFILKRADWIFFNSKNAIEHFFKLQPLILKKTKIGVLGRGSESTLRKYGRVADFSGDDLGISTEEIAQEFAK